MNFDQAFDALLKHEGGYSDHAADPGGKTRYGITEAVAREVGYRGEMRELPLELAQRIYRERYWEAVKADQLPSTVRYLVFDAAVNSGVGQAARWLQRAVKVKDDGVIGPMTLMAANQSNPEALARRVLAQRLRFMSGLANWPAFSRGWARRIADLMEVA
jgi:lysozyme family protein